MNQEYFLYLYKKIERKDASYKKLCHALHMIPFRWSVPNDDNRDYDGRALRIEYCDWKGKPARESMLSTSASVFEVLVAIAKRVEDMLSDYERGDRTAEWFWELISNLGLLEYYDLDWNDDISEPLVISSIDLFLDRRYDRLGRGGIFPLKRPMGDMRKVEIWYQMMIYYRGRV